jgi:energy-coupling factor transporter ATP-binding protein EcfA2
MNTIINQSLPSPQSPPPTVQKFHRDSINKTTVSLPGLLSRINQYQLVSQEKDYHFIISVLKDSISVDPLGREEVTELLHHKFNRSKRALTKTMRGLLSSVETGAVSLELSQDFHQFYHALQEHDLSGYQFIKEIYDWFIYERRGYFYTTENKPFLYYRGRIYEVGTNKVFTAFLAKLAKTTSKTCKKIAEELEGKALSDAKQIPQLSPIHVSGTNTIYLSISQEKLIKIAPSEEVRVMSNAFNPEGLLLSDSPSFLPIEIDNEVKVGEGLKRLKELVFDSLSCSLVEKYFTLCWFIILPLQELIETKPILKFTGNQSSGKSTGLKLLNTLWTGESTPELSTAFSCYHHASNNLLTTLDNLESKNINENLLQFLITAATGIKRRKMVGSTKAMVNKVKSMVLVTSIEPFTRPELSSRLWEVKFEDRYKSSSFIDSKTIKELKNSRELILNAIFKFIALEILPHLNEQEGWLKYLSSYEGNYKSRLDEFTSISLLILEKLLLYISDTDMGARDLCSQWIHTQNSYCDEQRDSFFLDCLNSFIEDCDHYIRNRKDGELKRKYKGIEVHIENGHYHFDATVKQISNLILLTSAINRSIHPYRYSNHLLMSRLRNDYEFLEKNGWEIKDNYKVVKGYPVTKFIKKGDQGDGGDGILKATRRNEYE